MIERIQGQKFHKDEQMRESVIESSGRKFPVNNKCMQNYTFFNQKIWLSTGTTCAHVSSTVSCNPVSCNAVSCIIQETQRMKGSYEWPGFEEYLNQE